MKITFPHISNAYLAVKAVFDGLGIEYVMPPFGNKKALEIGSLYSPEEICLPFKIMIGNYIQSIDKGADTIIITGSCGPCRFGEYCELQMNLLNKLGYNLEFIVIDSPYEIGKNEFLNRIGKIAAVSKKSTTQKLRSLRDGYIVINLIDYIEAKAHYQSGYEENKGECKRILNECKCEALEAKTPSMMIEILKKYRTLINNVKLDKNRNPIKIAITGEIYTILEPFTNLYIEDKLMDYGVSSRRSLMPSRWVKDIALSPFKLNALDIKKASKEYLKYNVGGFCRECIGETILAYEDGYDGVIQIFPMGCMPEIVSKSILPSISKDKNFPIMTLVVDEMTGEAGYVTRIEAFIDLLERRKNKNVLLRC